MADMGFRELRALDEANLRLLNEMLRQLYAKLYGRVEAKDLSPALRAALGITTEP